MSAPRRTLLTSSLARRVAVSAVAGLATVLVAAPVATAEDDLAPPDVGDDQLLVEEEPPADEPAPDEPVPDEPSVDEPDDGGPDVGQPKGVDDPRILAEPDEDEVDVEDPIEPEYGSQKYRVGVRPEPGVTLPEGLTTMGITVRVESSTGGDFTCVTSIADGTTSYCPSDDLPVPDALRRLAANAVVEPDPSPFPPGTVFTAEPGEELTFSIVESTVPEGLVADREAAVLEPCEADQVYGTGFCLVGLSVLQSGALLDVGLPEPAPDPDPAPDEPAADTAPANVALPDTGGSDAALLGLGTSLVGVGAWLAAGRRRPSVHAVAD